MRRLVAVVLSITGLLPLIPAQTSNAIIVDHGSTKLTKVPANWITLAKQRLHIVYGHTSHGSQVTSGMSGLVGFTGGCGGPQFAWNNGGTGGALDLHDYGMAGDCGYYPQWVNNTTAYLNTPANQDVNVVIWSWCGQHAGYTAQNMIDRYLAPMAQLEKQYPKVTFVYMTGHTNAPGTWQNTRDRNNQIRTWCKTNGCVLYDFADIESYDPDGKFYNYADDSCDYYNASFVKQGNWATAWQNSHVINVDWYSCSSAHSIALNANQKAYGAWWLWARLAGWQGDQSLQTDGDVISLKTGGKINFSLEPTPLKSQRSYLLLGSVTGTTPGMPLPGSTLILPLVFDSFTNIVLGSLTFPTFSGFLGKTDTLGRATATLQVPVLDASLVGLSMYYAYTLVTPFDHVSNPVRVRFTP